MLIDNEWRGNKMFITIRFHHCLYVDWLMSLQQWAWSIDDVVLVCALKSNQEFAITISAKLVERIRSKVKVSVTWDAITVNHWNELLQIGDVVYVFVTSFDGNSISTHLRLSQESWNVTLLDSLPPSYMHCDIGCDEIIPWIPWNKLLISRWIRTYFKRMWTCEYSIWFTGTWDWEECTCTENVVGRCCGPI